MNDLLKQLIEKETTVEDKINRTREFLQELMLKVLFDRGAFSHLAFTGGTALRVLYGLRRYSEDLDFSLIKKQNYSFDNILRDLVFEIKHFGFEVEKSASRSNIVNSCLIKFPGLLAELGLSAMKSHKLAVKLEIDTNPPAGGTTILTPVAKAFVFVVNSFDLPSMYATKLHACFFRSYIKGRDFYDLVWYLGKKIEPNYLLLNNAIKQTEKKELNLGPDNLPAFMKENLAKIDFALAKKDVERFLEDKSELKLFDKDLILSML